LFAELLAQINPALTAEACRVRALVLTAQIGGMMIFAHRSGDAGRDLAEFVRTTKRYARKIAGLSGGLIVDSDQSAREYRQILEDDARQSVARGTRPRSGVFGSESHLMHGRLELTAGHVSVDATYRRPTMQGKRRESKVNDIVTTAATVLAEEG